MKKILLTFLLFVSSSLAVNLFSQVSGCEGGASSCHLTPQDVRITITDRDCSDPTKTVITFNVNFKLEANSGNKVIYFHSWLEADYPSAIGTTIYKCLGTGTENGLTAGAPGNLGTLVTQPNTSILDIGLNNDASPAVGTTVPMGIRASNQYAPDASVVLISNTGPIVSAPDMTVTKTALAGGLDSISAENVVVTINQPCFLPDGVTPTPIIVKTLVWASNASNSTKAQCWASNIRQSYNDPSVSLVKICASSPFKYDIGIQTASSTDIHVVYRLRAHDPLLGNAKLPGDPVIFTSDTIVLKNTNPYDPLPMNLPDGYCCFDPWAQWDIYVEVTGREFANIISTPLVAQACETLPVNLKSFNAARKNSSVVDLKWETAQEINNKGFYIERKLSNGSWKTISFLDTKAVNGNSNSPLTYDFTDLNNAKGISQYRLRQLDLDGKQSYSLIRSVRGEGQKAKTIIYPNPSGDGKVTVVFEDANSPRDVSLLDVSGRTIKQWKGVTNNTIQVDNLNSGFYTVRILNVETGEQVVEKFIVNKR